MSCLIWYYLAVSKNIYTLLQKAKKTNTGYVKYP